MAAPLIELLRDRRVLIGLGAVLALGLGLGGAFLIVSHDKGAAGAPPASHGGLVVQTGRDDDVKLDPKRPLRCFVDGKFVGELTLDECAKRNGVASGALDVGVDPTGALAASGVPSAQITPLNPQAPPPALQAPGVPAVLPPPASAMPPQPPAIIATPVHAPSGACWRNAGGEWKKLPADMTLNACVQALYAGHCARKGEADYGRWIDQTLRAVPGRIEVSPDNHNFRPLVEQGAGCAVPALG